MQRPSRQVTRDPAMQLAMERIKQNNTMYSMHPEIAEQMDMKTLQKEQKKQQKNEPLWSKALKEVAELGMDLLLES